MIAGYALSMGVIGKVQQVADGTLREAQFATMPDEAETRPMRRAVSPRVARRPRGRGQQPDLIVARCAASRKRRTGMLVDLSRFAAITGALGKPCV